MVSSINCCGLSIFTFKNGLRVEEHGFYLFIYLSIFIMIRVGKYDLLDHDDLI